MKILYKALIIIFSFFLLFFLIIGWYPGRYGTVVDAETGTPIEGAIVYGEWDITKGIGLTATYLYKRVETITDKEGKFYLPGVWRPFVNHPQIVIYKRGYIAWRNDFIFPDYKKRYDSRWKIISTYRLERFIEGRYLHTRHISFIESALNLNTSFKLDKAIYWESRLGSKENELYRKKKLGLKKGEKNDDEIWKEILQELYSSREKSENE